MAATGLSVSIPTGAASGASACAPGESASGAESAHSFSSALSRVSENHTQAAATDDAAAPVGGAAAKRDNAGAKESKTSAEGSDASPAADAAALALILPLLPSPAVLPPVPVPACANASATASVLALQLPLALPSMPKADKTAAVTASDPPSEITLSGTADFVKTVSDGLLAEISRDVQASLTHSGSGDNSPGVATMLQGDPRTAFVVPQFPTAEATTAHHATPPNQPHAHPTVHTPVGGSGWSDDLGAQLTMMARHGVQSASLSLSPAHLGPLEIKIEVHSDHASVWFGAAQPETRAAVEQALPRLRELFASQGLALTDAGVSRESPHDTSRSAAPRSGNPNFEGDGAEPVTALYRARLGLVDTYA
jgi:flagellar hook-length control protein FliK